MKSLTDVPVVSALLKLYAAVLLVGSVWEFSQADSDETWAVIVAVGAFVPLLLWALARLLELGLENYRLSHSAVWDAPDDMVDDVEARLKPLIQAQTHPAVSPAMLARIEAALARAESRLQA
jgi:hypothetical protein